MLMLYKLQFVSEQSRLWQCIMAASVDGTADVIEPQNVSAKGRCDVCPSDKKEAQIHCYSCKKWFCMDHIQVRKQSHSQAP